MCTGSTHAHRHTPTFPCANVAFSGFVILTHFVHLHPALSVTTLQTPAVSSPYSLGCFTSSSLSTLLVSSFSDNHVRSHTHSPKVPNACLSRNRSIQSPPPQPKQPDMKVLTTQMARAALLRPRCAIPLHAPTPASRPPSLLTPLEINVGLAEAN